MSQPGAHDSLPGLAATVLSQPGGPATPEPSPEPPGPDFEYRCERLLGQGGMAAVYLAVQRQTGATVALKVLHPTLAGHEEVVARFRAEASTARLIESDHVVRVQDVGALPDGRPYLAMEYLEGETLQALLARGRVAQALARDVLLQLCDALAAAHARGVTHRDLKPENVFLLRTREERPFVKVMDFGIAKVHGSPARTRHGAVMGTPEYMAPEQCEGRTTDARTDLYALGVVAYELLVGRRPFVDPGPVRQMMAHLHQDVPPPRQLAPELPEAADALLLRALAKVPELRFQTAAEFASALRQALPDAWLAELPRRQGPRQPVALQALASWSAGAPQRLRVLDLSVAGAFLCAEPPLPEVGTPVFLALDPGPGALALEATVVRQARSPQGFAVRFAGLEPAARRALEALQHRASLSLGAGGARPLVLDRFRAAGTDLYALLALTPDAPLEALQRSAASLGRELEAVSPEPLEPAARDELARARLRLTEVSAVLADASSRLDHDVAIGNWRGVARALASGLEASALGARREAFLRARPGAELQAALYVGRATLAESWGDKASAVRELEVALALDPLRLELHQRRARLLAT